MKKAVIIGGNQGGLNMARCLSEAGFSVEVFEKKEKKDVAYDWTDDINPEIFAKTGIGMPPEGTYYPKKAWTFVSPSEKVKITVRGGAQKNDISIYRRDLNDYLFSLAEGKAEIHYGTEAEKLLFDGNKVTGIKALGKEIHSDIVVDCSGAFSPFRESAADKTGMKKQPEKDELFVVYRGFFKAEKESEKPEATNKVYLRHGGSEGISWCIYNEEENNVDVLIGRIGELDERERDKAFMLLEKDNPILSDVKEKEWVKAVIPVTHPGLRIVGDGYVLCGDSAFMTIPVMGSGIVCSLECGEILKKVLTENDDCSLKNLWKYQVEFYNRYASFFGVDFFKRWLLKVDVEDVDYLFESGIADEKMLAEGAGGETMKLGLSDLIKKAWKGRNRAGLLLQIAEVLRKSALAESIAKEIPTEYDEKKTGVWQTKLERIYR